MVSYDWGDGLPPNGTKFMKLDAISVVEAAYDCESELRTWWERLLEHVAPRLDRGLGVTLSTYAPDMRTEDVRFAGAYSKPGIVEASKAMVAAYPAIFHRVMQVGRPLDTPSAAMGLSVREARVWPPYVEYMHSLGVREVIGVVARDPSGHAIFFSAPSPDLRRPAPRERLVWSRIAAHICAGARLRRALPIVPGDVAEGADAVLSPGGAIEHAEVHAQGDRAIESLRRAARAIDRARSKARSNDEEALELWRGSSPDVGPWSTVSTPTAVATSSRARTSPTSAIRAP